VELRFYIDPETDEPHVYRHGVSVEEVEEVLSRPLEDRPGAEGSRVAVGLSRAGRYLRVIYVPDPKLDSVFVITAYQRPQGHACLAPEAQEEAMSKTKYPPGWDEHRVRRVLEHYETQSDEEAVAEDEAAYEATTHTAMGVPVDLVPAVREMIAKRRSASA